MALIKCKDCGKEISDQAEVCPNCGAKTEIGKYHDASIEEKKYKDFELAGFIFSVVNSIISCIISYNIYDNASWREINYHGGELLLKILLVWVISISIDVVINYLLKGKRESLERLKSNFVSDKSDSLIKNISNSLSKKQFWTCPKCDVRNSTNSRFCSACGTKKPSDAYETKKPYDAYEEEWTCPDCNKSNSGIYNTCQHCGSSRPRHVKKS